MKYRIEIMPEPYRSEWEAVRWRKPDDLVPTLVALGMWLWGECKVGRKPAVRVVRVHQDGD